MSAKQTHDPSASDPGTNPWCVYWSDPPPSGLTVLLFYPTATAVFEEIIDSNIEVAYKDADEVHPEAREAARRFARDDVDPDEFRAALKHLIDANYVWAGTFDELRQADNEATALVVDQFLERRAEERDEDYAGAARPVGDDEVDAFAAFLREYNS